MTHSLLSASLDLTAQLDLPDVLQDFVDSAADLTGARYSALAVLDNAGETTVFVQHGLPAETRAQLARPPRSIGVFAAIPNDGALLLDDLTEHPDFQGWPEGHPPMRGFLGLPVRINEQVFGRLYLADKEGGFTRDDVDAVTVLARAAAVAVANARVYAQSRNRERWMRVSQAITTTLLEGTEEEEALQMIAQQVREVADADTSVIVLPSVGDTWAGEIADGTRANELIGVEFPPNGRALTVLREGVGVIVDSLARARPMRVPQLSGFGPAMYAPMMVRGVGLGVILLLREVGRPEFEPNDLAMAESLAQQAALALELAAARHSDDVSNLLGERQRIGRDLHDLAIQQLFATGMKLEGARQSLVEAERPDLAEIIEESLEAVDDSVRQIRSIVQSLREADDAVVLVERLRREASIGRTALGFAPSLIISVDGQDIDDSLEEPGLIDVIDARVDSDIADDVVAIMREGLSNAARHARASSVQVRIEVAGSGPTGWVSVEVEDDGVGIPREIARRSGVDNMAARARRHHGEFTLEPTEDRTGSLLRWRAPLT